MIKVKEAVQKDISKLQQDQPADLVQLANSQLAMENAIKKPKLIEETKPFFLYPRDGLYGLL